MWAPRMRIGAVLAAAWLISSILAGQDAGRSGDLESIRDEIRQLEGRLAEAERRESGLAGRLERLDLELELQTQRLAEARTARAGLLAEIDRSSSVLTRLETELVAAREGLRRRVVGLYRLGRQGYLRLFSSLRSDGDLLQAVRMLRYLARRDADSIESFTETRQKVEETRAKLVSRQEEAERWAAEEKRRRDRLATLRRDQLELLSQNERERRALAERSRELILKERRLSELIASFSGGQQLSGRRMQEFQGVLDWPAEGRVTVGFGPRLDPLYGTRVPHNGVEIATRRGGPVRAVFGGKVLFAAPFESYGPTVVLLHPGRVYTLYAGLEDLRAAKDQELALGATVGASGDNLYFEVRVDNRPRDPRRWLR